MSLELIMACFALLAAADRIFGSPLGLGKEFEKGLMLLGSMALSMIGMIVISPVIAGLVRPLLSSGFLGLDPSILPSILFANDMGGAALASELAVDPSLGLFNGLIVSTMMGCTLSFTIPVALEMLDPSRHRDFTLGILCGMAAIPTGCLLSGLFCGLSLISLLSDLIPVVLIAALIAVGLLKFPEISIRIFKIFGIGIKVLITVGLGIGIFQHLTGYTLLPGTETYAEGGRICLNAAAVMSGAFPLVNLLSRLLKKPIQAMGRLLGINSASALGLVSSMASSLTAMGNMKDMDAKGIVINAAFMVSGASVFAAHMAFTMAFDKTYTVPMIVGKLTSGIFGILAALFVYRRLSKAEPAKTEKTK